MKRWAFAAVLAGAAMAQNANPVLMRIDVNLVQVDAVVTDSQNHPVANLKPEDFVVLQDDKPQTISNFSYVSAAHLPAPAKPPAASETGIAAPPVPALALPAADVRRMFAMVVDDLGLDFANIARVHQALASFVDRDMQPGDMVAIIRASGGLGVLQQFTNDRKVLHAAIDRIRFNPGNREGYSIGVLGALRWVIGGLRDMPGRKTVLLFSQNMTSEMIAPVAERIIDAANRAAVAIDPIDPRGILNPPMPHVGKGGSSLGLTERLAAREAQMAASQEGLRTLAEGTGGVFVHNQNFIDQAVREATADSESYYLIGYHPETGTFDPESGQGKYHRLQVKVKTPGLQVRSRSGFLGETETALRTDGRSAHDDLMHEVTSPFSSGDIPVRLTALYQPSPDGDPYVNAMLHIDATELEFAAQPDGGQKTVLEIATMTFGVSGEPVDQSDRRFEIALTRAQYAGVLKYGLVYRINQPLKDPGMYQVRVALRDEESGQLGSASQFLETPDLAKGQLALSSILLAEDAGRKEEGSASHAEGRVADGDPTSSAAERVFAPGAALSYSYTIFNARTGAGKTDLQVRTRIFRDGQQVYEGQPMAPDVRGPDQKCLTAGGNMVLAKNIPTGDYVLQVIVEDRLAPQKRQISVQSMDFQVRQ